MSKAVTLSDLNEALKPIHMAIKQMKEERTRSDMQINEINQLAVSISTKLDILEQQLSSISLSVSSQPAPRKLAGRKGSTKKPVVKKGKGKKDDADDADAGEAGDVDEADADGGDADEADADGGDADEADADADETEESKKSKKSTVKKAPTVKAVKKEPAKKTAKAPAKKKAPAKAPVKKTGKLNKMQYFKKAFEEDESKFSKYFNAKVKKQIDTDNKSKFEGKEGDDLQKARTNVYYIYMRDKHGDDLDKMRDAYAEESKTEGDGEGDGDAADNDAEGDEESE